MGPVDLDAIRRRVYQGAGNSTPQSILEEAVARVAAAILEGRVRSPAIYAQVAGRLAAISWYRHHSFLERREEWLRGRASLHASFVADISEKLSEVEAVREEFESVLPRAFELACSNTKERYWETQYRHLVLVQAAFFEGGTAQAMSLFPDLKRDAFDKSIERGKRWILKVGVSERLERVLRNFRSRHIRRSVEILQATGKASTSQLRTCRMKAATL